jgi:hypothetical protein
MQIDVNLYIQKLQNRSLSIRKSKKSASKMDFKMETRLIDSPTQRLFTTVTRNAL